MHLTIVRNLFKIDPSQDKKPKSITAMKKKDPKVLLAEARTVAKKRVNMTQNCCDRFILVFEALQEEHATVGELLWLNEHSQHVLLFVEFCDHTDAL